MRQSRLGGGGGEEGRKKIKGNKVTYKGISVAALQMPKGI